MRPGPPRDLHLKPLSASSLRLSYAVPSQMREFPAGLVQAVTISSAHQPGVWTSLDTNISREHQKVGNYAFEFKNYFTEILHCTASL